MGVTASRPNARFCRQQGGLHRGIARPRSDKAGVRPRWARAIELTAVDVVFPIQEAVVVVSEQVVLRPILRIGAEELVRGLHDDDSADWLQSLHLLEAVCATAKPR